MSKLKQNLLWKFSSSCPNWTANYFIRNRSDILFEGPIWIILVLLDVLRIILNKGYDNVYVSYGVVPQRPEEVSKCGKLSRLCKWMSYLTQKSDMVSTFLTLRYNKKIYINRGLYFFLKIPSCFQRTNIFIANKSSTNTSFSQCYNSFQTNHRKVSIRLAPAVSHCAIRTERVHTENRKKSNIYASHLYFRLSRTRGAWSPESIPSDSPFPVQLKVDKLIIKETLTKV